MAIITQNIRVGVAVSTTLVVLYYTTLQMKGISKFLPPLLPGPTYWPTTLNKNPDSLGIFVAKISSNLHYSTDNIFDWNSDRFSVLLIISATPLTRVEPSKLFTTQTDIKKFHDIINEKIDLKIKLKTTSDIDKAVNNLTTLIQQAAWTLQNLIKPVAQSKIIQILITSYF